MDSDDLRRWARRSSGPRADRAAAAPPASVAPAAVASAPPSAPPGFLYVWEPRIGQFVLIVDPNAAAAAPAPFFGGPPAPPPPGGVRFSAPAGGRPPPIRTCKLVRPGDVDKYAEMLAQTPEIMPSQASHLFGGLQPRQQDVDILLSGGESNPNMNYHPPVPADPKGRVSISDDPGEDAFPRPVVRAPIRPLAELPPGSAPPAAG